MFLIFDTETTGIPKSWKAPISDTDNWPRMVQLAWQMHDIDGNLIGDKNYVIYPDGYEIPNEVVDVHGINTQTAIEQGVPLSEALTEFMKDVAKSKFIVGHNINFDVSVVGCELIRCDMDETLSSHPSLDTMTGSKEYCNLKRGGNLKNPTLSELHIKLFKVPFDEAHNAAADVEATSRCFLELIRVGGFPENISPLTADELVAFRNKNPRPIKAAGIKYESFKKDIFEGFSLEEEEQKIAEAAAKNTEVYPFVHLHVHTQYSILDGANKIGSIIKKAFDDNMPAVAVTDHGRMFGIKEFHAECGKFNKGILQSKIKEATEGKNLSPEEEEKVKEKVKEELKDKLIKPILGVEAYVARRGHLRKEDRIDISGEHLILLAKNYTGYVNLLKLISAASTDGFYMKPRIDKELLKQHSEGLIVTSACLGGEIPQHLLKGNIGDARKSIMWFKSVFADDFYLEISRHINDDPINRKDVWENQAKVSRVILKLAKECGVKVIATNDAHYTNQDDAEAQDLLVCLNTGRDYNDPTRMRYTKQEWFKTRKEMSDLFADLPETLTNTIEIANKVEEFTLDRDPFMPAFDIPEEFGTFEEYKSRLSIEDIKEEFTEKVMNRLGGYEKTLQIKFESDFLEHLTFEGAKKRYPDKYVDDILDHEIKERLDFELNTIKTMGFPGYFLIVQDFINWAKNNEVLVGPGRGSAAGAAVAYCVGITDIDPIKYDLLFERFLNPDRISMPDVDIDFDDDGRQKVLNYVTEKYGKDKVAHICTFGSMATKSAIKDVARVLGLPIYESSRLANLVPEAPKMNFPKAYKESPELEREKDSPEPLIRQTLTYAESLEGAVRQTGVHACGVLIGKNPLREHIPLMLTKGEEMLSTQYDGAYVEDIGLLKMDFLGLKTLSIIKEVLANIKLAKGEDIDLSKISLTDKKTFELFSKGETTAIFQFESLGMKKHLRALIPDKFEDLVAMNALYRPGPMEYIPSFIARKHGREEIIYDHPMMEPYLRDTYGITVYQEQVMLQSRALGGFTRGDSDSLRKAMGKKNKAMMDNLKVKFIKGCTTSEEFTDACKNGKTEIKEPEKLVEKIWKDWEAFASYAFNKSHSVCYAYVAYQTGYLKAHYPAEFMAGVLTNNRSDMTKVTTFMEECRSMGLPVLGPCVNESYSKFTVNQNGEIRFGMSGIKGVGDGAVEEIIKEREANGPYKDIFDFVERVNNHTANKKNLEALAGAGGFDCFNDIHRGQYFHESKENETTFIEELINYSGSFKQDKGNTQLSLFGDILNDEMIVKPKAPQVPELSILETIGKEKDLIGIHLSAHPLDIYKFEVNKLCSTRIADLDKLKDNNVVVGGIVTDVRTGTSKKNGSPYGFMTISDYTGTYEIGFFGEEFAKYSQYLVKNYYLRIKGRIGKKWRTSTDYSFIVNEICFLEGLRDKEVKSITIKINLMQLNERLLTDIVANIEGTEKGSVNVIFKVYDMNEINGVEYQSNKKLIELNDDFLNFLENNKSIEYTVSQR